MKLKVGMYVRTIKGTIFKVEWLNDTYYGTYEKDGRFYRELFKNINGEIPYKCNFNVMKLIEHGDYVNGGVVIDIHPNCIYVADRRNNHNGALLPTEVYQIEEILTHEQYEKNVYKIEERK